MATTNSIRVAGKGRAGQGGDGGTGRFGLKAKLTAAVVAVGCAAALAFGGLQVRDTAGRQPVAPPLAAPALAADYGGDSENPRWCSQTPGPFACAER